MRYPELEGRTLDELIAAFRGPPLGGERYRASFYDDIATRIALLGGCSFLEGELKQGDGDRLAAAVRALAFCSEGSIDRRAVRDRLRGLLDHRRAEVTAAAIGGLVDLDDREVHDRVLALFEEGPALVRAQALAYLEVLFPDSSEALWRAWVSRRRRGSRPRTNQVGAGGCRAHASWMPCAP